MSVPNSNQPSESPGPEVQQIIDLVGQQAGEAWLVGGFVRDRLLERDTNDIDLSVRKGAISLARTVADAFAGHFFVLDESRDVARAIIPRAAGPGITVDVARLRAGELTGDLRLRDFTVNAMAVPVDPGAAPEVIDPFGGRADLRQGIIRAVTDVAFLDDPLRLLRAVRQSAELGFRIDDDTYDLIRRDAARLTTVAAERVRDELARILWLPGSWHSLRVMQDAGLLVHVLPEAAALVGTTQSPPHHQDVFDHTRTALKHLEAMGGLIWSSDASISPVYMAEDPLPFLDDCAWAELASVIAPYSGELAAYLGERMSADRNRWHCLGWAVLAHDWGKPAMRSVDEDGRIRFLGHDDWGAMLAQARLRALHMSSGEVGHISRLVGLHMRPGYLARDYPPSRRAVYRFFRDARGAGPDCVLLSLADYSATRSGNPTLEAWQPRLKTAALLLDSYFRERRERLEPVPLLDGRQLMSTFGLSQGPRIGHLLEALREAQAAGEVTCYEEAVAWLRHRLQMDGK